MKLPPVARGGLWALAAMLPVCMALEDSLSGRLQGGKLFLSAPNLQLVRGEVLDQLKNGSTVAFDFHLTLWVGARTTARRRSFERFLVSYDLWEESFSVTGLRQPRSTVSGLTAGLVPAWCLDHVSLVWPDVRPGTPFWLRLEVQQAEKKSSREPGEGSSIDLKQLIEWFSAPGGRASARWVVESGRLERLPQ